MRIRGISSTASLACVSDAVREEDALDPVQMSDIVLLVWGDWESDDARPRHGVVRA